MRAHRGTLALLGALALAAAATPGESAARAEYVSLLEPICETNTNANRRILRNVRQRARKRATMRQAGVQFVRAAAAFGSTVGEMAAVPRPPEDAARLGRWFKQLRVVQANLRKLGRALKKRDRILAAHEQIRVERSSNAANNIGFAFRFHQCRLTPSRFT